MKFSTERPPSLELVLRENSIDLLGHLAPREGGSGKGHGANGHGGDGHSAGDYEEVVFFRVPLDTKQLAEFRSHDPSNEAGNGNETGAGAAPAGAPWQAFYSGGDEALGIEWQLRLRDLDKKSQWDRWKILEPASMPFGAGRR